jgi:hypothetical protein
MSRGDNELVVAPDHFAAHTGVSVARFKGSGRPSFPWTRQRYGLCATTL